MKKYYQKIAAGLIVILGSVLMVSSCVQYIEDDIGPDAGPLTAGDLFLDGFPVWTQGVEAPEGGYCADLEKCLCEDSWNYDACIQSILSMTESECRVALNNPMLDCDNGNEGDGYIVFQF
jgi:hypothetical protein